MSGTLIPVSAPKINPKASAGAINANLRALDRTGKPCRRWQKAGFTVKSFTGVMWTSGAWASKKRVMPTEEGASGDSTKDGKSESSTSEALAASNIKQNNINLNGNPASSAVPSEKSGSAVDTPALRPTEPASSPAPASVSA